ncbi:unnamed protein product [Spirodela intermedia]|uniref:Uncharacterized protein n=1 Tax=Spirodela intermedia TaxID=51605 RepID=A0A7I8JJ99_SPIIN|nr:unnamed protein product [Spirodela intermedia]CAA6669492.1 unnamed protein product [Spirodela intermedia]
MFCRSSLPLAEISRPVAISTRVTKTHCPPSSTGSFRVSLLHHRKRTLAKPLSAPRSTVPIYQCEDEEEEDNEEEQLRVEPSSVKWVEIGPEITHEQAQAIARLPPKMTKRCRALMRHIICFSPQQGNLPLLLSAWVKVMKPKRADWLSVLKETKRLEDPLFLQVFQYALLEDSFEANIRDYTNIIGAFAEQKRFQDAEATFLAMKRKGFAPDQVTLTLLVNLYSKAGRFEQAKETFGEIRFLGEPLDKRAYGSMIMAYIRAGKPEEGEMLLREMDAQEIYACKEVYKAMLRAYSLAGRPDGAQRIFDAIQLAGIVPDARLCALLIHSYCAVHQSDEAMSPNDKCVALMIGAFQEEGKLDRAVSLLMDLERDGVVTGRETSNVLTQWFRRLGLSDELEDILRS